MNRLLKAVLTAAIAAGLFACSAAPKDPTVNWSARKIYNEATKELHNGDSAKAVEYFEILESRYPFGRYTLQSQLDIAYAHYKHGEYDIAVDASDRFIKLHPRNAHIDYAYYLKGLANFTRGTGLLTNFIGRNLSEYDQQSLARSFANFDTLIRRFPTSKYAADARQRMIFLRNEMAEHELTTAEFYFGRGAMIATVNRVKFMLENYGGAQSIPDGLALMAKAYSNLGQDELASDTLRVLASNAPEHPALQEK